MRKSSFDTGGQTALTQELSNWSANRRAERSKAVTEQSYQEGLKEGMGAKTIERKKPLFGFIGADAAEAHNKGLEAAYLAGIDSDNISRINEIAMKNEGNVKGYDAEIEGLMSGLQKEVDPELSQTIMFSARQLADKQRLIIQKQAFANQQKVINSQLLSSSVTYAEAAARSARNGDIESADGNIAKYIAVQNQRLESGAITQAEYDINLRDVNREANEHALYGQIDNMPLNEATKWLQENKAVPDWATADEYDSFYSKASAGVNRRLSKANAQKAAVLSQNKIRLKDYRERSAKGYDISDREKNIIRSIDIDAYKQGEQLASFAQMSRKKREAIVENLSAIESSDPQSVLDIKKAHEEINAEAEENAYALAVKQGKIEHIEIDMSNSESIATRIATIEAIEDEYGVNTESIFSPAEGENFAQSLVNATISEQVVIIDAINGIGTSSGSKRVYQELYNKGAGVMAWAGTSDSQVTRMAILQGQEELKSGNVTKVKQTEYLPDLQETVKGVYRGENLKALREAALAHYYSKGEEVYSPSSFRDSIKAVAGEFDEVNGRYVQLPRGVDADKLERYFEGFSSDFVDQLGGVASITSSQAAMIINDGMPVYAGTEGGLDYYYIEHQNHSDIPETLIGSDGKPLKIPYKKEWVEKQLQNIKETAVEAGKVYREGLGRDVIAAQKLRNKLKYQLLKDK